MRRIVLGEGRLSVADVAAVARQEASIALGREAEARIEAGRELVERFLAEDRPVYGMTRGLGGRVVTAVDPGERSEMSHILLRARACGSGPLFEEEQIRAFLTARLASLSLGHAGVRPLVAETLAAMLERGVHPAVHEIGGHGASDLPLMAELALPVMGEGRAFHEGSLLPGGDAMEKAGLKPLRLKEKEGLSLCSASSVSAGLGALVLDEARRLLALGEAIAVLSFEAFRANLSPIDARIAAAHPAPGQEAAADRLRRLLAESGLNRPDAARRLQDPISLRCASHAFAGLASALDFAEPAVLAEINGSGDNPCVLFESEQIFSTGNFQTIGLAQGFDLLALALTTVAGMGAQRCGRLLRKSFTDLPDGLSPLSEGTVRIGMALLGLNTRQTVKDMRILATPASLDQASGYDVEDQEPSTPLAVRKAWKMLPLLRQVLACELIVAAEALDQRQPASPAPVAAALRDAVREHVPTMADDRSLSEDIEKTARLLQRNDLPEAVTRHLILSS